MNNNKAWGRPNNSPNMINQNPLQPQLLNQAANALGHMGSGMAQFQQQQVFQNSMQQNLNLGLQQMANNAISAATLNSQIASNPIFQQVTYPNTRGLNPTAFQSNLPQVAPVQNNANTGAKQRVLTGKVTQIHDNFGLVDEEVIFQMNACVKGSNPVVGDRVLVEAQYTPNLHFKWSATRIQVLHVNKPSSSRNSSNNSKSYGNSSGYNAVAPPEPSNFGRNSRQKAVTGRGRERSRERDRDDDEIERKRRREERLREREKEDKKSPVRRRSRSPKSRRRSRVVPRYMVQVPKIALDLTLGDVLEVRKRYNNLYIPSDFFFTNIEWVHSFPPDKPFALNKACSFHIMNKEVDPLLENDAVLEPADADYIFSAKVMLMSIPGIEELYQRCCGIAEDKDKRDRESEDRDFVHPTRLINFLVGLRGKNETMAIGGPWSPSLDGENPDKDPSVLIRTAIRTCKALTGIDLSNCTQWYRFVELYYRRSESTHKGRLVPARVETVVLFLPDIWSCLPTRLEWDGVQQSYRKQWEQIVASSSAAPADAVAEVPSPVEQEEGNSGSAAAASADEKEEELLLAKPDPTHFSKLDPKTMNVNDLRNELKARSISSKGLKSQLAARLVKALKTEAENDNEGTEVKEVEEKEDLQEKKSEVEEKEKKQLDDREKAILEKRHTLPEQPHVLVHPSRTAKSGKFDCTVMSLSLLLDYRPEDTKEHSFEVSLFAELFNEMLMRDFGFIIFKALYELPEKVKDEKKDKEKEEKKERDDKKDKDEKKKDDDRKTDDKTKEKDVEKKNTETDKSRKSEDDDQKKEKEVKKDDRRSDDSEDDDDSEDEKDKKKDKDRKKKERVKLVTKDKHLLLSFIYFDQSHCGYIFDKDIEDLLYTLGLKLSRAQVRKLVTKVVTRDSLHYRKLTDKPKDEVITQPEKVTNLQDLAIGNKKLLPMFNDSLKRDKAESDGSKKGQQDGLVLFGGSLVDVGKLMSQLDRSEKARLDTEARMVDLKSENHRLSEKYSKSNSSIKHLNSEVKEYKDKLRSTEDSLSRITAYSKLFQMTLVDIRDKIDPVLKSTTHKEEVKKEKDEKDKDRKHEENKTRWEKEKEKEKEKEIKKMDVDVESTEVKKEN